MTIDPDETLRMCEPASGHARTCERCGGWMWPWPASPLTASRCCELCNATWLRARTQAEIKAMAGEAGPWPFEWLARDGWHVEIRAIYRPRNGSRGRITFTVGAEPEDEAQYAPRR